MTESKVKTPEGMHTITPHIVVSDAAAAADWYKQVLGAEERSRIEVPGGKLMQVELWYGDSAVMLADEFPELEFPELEYTRARANITSVGSPSS